MSKECEVFGYIGFGNHSYPATKKECLNFCKKYDNETYLKLKLRDIVNQQEAQNE